MRRELTISLGNDSIAATLHKPDTEKIRSPEGCVITCHGLLASRESLKAVMVAERCETMGYYALRFDFRGCGDSDGILEDSISSQRLHDLEAVLAYVRNDLGIRRIGLFGSSLGGYVSLLLAGVDGDIHTIVSVSTPHSMAELLEVEMGERGYYMIDDIRIGANFLHDARLFDSRLHGTLGKLDAPVLLVHGSDDAVVPVEHAHRLFDSIRTDKKLLIMEDADHGFSREEHLESLVGEAVEWFAEKLGSSPVGDFLHIRTSKTDQ